MENEDIVDNGDGTCTIPFEIDDENLLILMKAAHEKDITFNQYMMQVLTEYIEYMENKNEK